MRVRMMQPQDVPAIWQMAAAQNRRDGTSYPVPPVFEMDRSNSRYGQLLENVPLALVTEVNGRVRQGHIWLRTIEEMSFGGGREAMDFSGQHIPMALELLRRKGYDSAHTFVPTPRVEDFREMLEREGFKRLDHRLAHFFRMLEAPAETGITRE